MKEAKLNINSNDLEDILAYTLANIKEKIPGNLLFQDTKVQLTIISERTSQILKNSSLAHEGWFESINNHYMI